MAISDNALTILLVINIILLICRYLYGYDAGGADFHPDFSCLPPWIWGSTRTLRDHRDIQPGYRYLYRRSAAYRLSGVPWAASRCIDKVLKPLVPMYIALIAALAVVIISAQPGGCLELV